LGCLSRFAHGMTREPEYPDHSTDDQHVTDAALALARLFARMIAVDIQELAPHPDEERADGQDPQ